MPEYDDDYGYDDDCEGDYYRCPDCDELEEDCECEGQQGRFDVDYDHEYRIDGVGFADPGGVSALRAATRDNPRDCPCPTCGDENVLTRADVARGYQCNRCADQAECGW